MKEYRFKINGNEYNVAIGDIKGKNANVTVNGVDYAVELDNEVSASAAPAAPVQQAAAPAAAEAPAAKAAPAGAGKVITSPLPGVIISVDVKEGQAVKRGQRVAVIEAMKMENEILAESDGTITAIHVSKGDQVLEGAEVVTIA